MKTIITFFILTIFCSACASQKEKQTKYYDESNPVFNPLVLDWIYNGGGNKYVPTINDAKININFSKTLGGSTGIIGTCFLRHDVADREILINESIWNENPEKKVSNLRKLLNACYVLQADAYPFYEFTLYGM
jgi:hypothetical protein